MSSFLKETATKIAGNVTQSVTSAILVTLITTYVLVDIGKKDSAPAGVNSDSLKVDVAPPPVQQPLDKSMGSVVTKTNQDQPAAQNVLSSKTQALKSGGRDVPVVGTSGNPVEAVKDATEKGPKERKLEASLANTKAKTDTASKEKKIPKDIKQVKERANDVFDELDEEEGKKPPQ